ncbi:MAG: glycosyltransferase family 2 protein [Candidatus Acidifodinimicrobium sp.]
MRNAKLNNRKPRISVVIPTYNEVDYVGDLLKSISKQTYKDYEIIGVDSYSDDGTVKIFKKYGSKIVMAKKKNVASAYNHGIKAAKGEIIALIDADYVLSKKLFEHVVREFEKNDRLVCIEPTIKIRNKDIPRDYKSRFIAFNKLIVYLKKISYHTSTPFAYGCVFIRGSAMKKAGLFNENIYVDENWEFYPRLKKFGEFKMLRDTAQVSYRRLAANGIIKSCILYLRPSISIALKGSFKYDFKAIRRGRVID